MPRTIFKYPVSPGHFSIGVPRNHTEPIVRSVAMLNGYPYVWVEHDSEWPRVYTLEDAQPKNKDGRKLDFYAVVTGKEFDATGYSFIGSCVADYFVVHVYQKDFKHAGDNNH